MSEKRWLYFVLGVTTVTSIGAVTNQLMPLQPPIGVALSDSGITFPDGTVQRTAAVEAGATVRNNIRWTCTTEIPDGQYGGSCVFPDVPEGKILVVDFASGWVSVPQSQRARVSYGLTSYFSYHVMLLHYQATLFGEDYYHASQSVRFYVNELQFLFVGITRDAPSGYADAQFWITGFLVDAGDPE